MGVDGGLVRRIEETEKLLLLLMLLLALEKNILTRENMLRRKNLYFY